MLSWLSTKRHSSTMKLNTYKAVFSKIAQALSVKFVNFYFPIRITFVHFEVKNEKIRIKSSLLKSGFLP